MDTPMNWMFTIGLSVSLFMTGFMFLFIMPGWFCLEAELIVVDLFTVGLLFLFLGCKRMAKEAVAK